MQRATAERGRRQIAHTGEPPTDVEAELDKAELISDITRSRRACESKRVRKAGLNGYVNEKGGGETAQSTRGIAWINAHDATNDGSF